MRYVIDVSGLKLSLDAGLPENDNLALEEIARQLRIEPQQIKSSKLLKRSVDARKRSNVHFIASYRLELSGALEEKLLASERRFKGLTIKPAKPYVPLQIPQLKNLFSMKKSSCMEGFACDAPREQSAKSETNAESICDFVRPVVVGMGPAGLFAAWYLAKAGLEPLVVEQGAPVEERAQDVATFFETGKLDPVSNIQFGEGGAGTFSDGKLTTNAKNKHHDHVLHWFVDAGAPEEILWQAHPHLGSDNLARIVANIRKDIIALGGEVRFHTKLVGVQFEQGSLASIELADTHTASDKESAICSGRPETRSCEQAIEVLPCETLVLACGHSARDVFELVRDAGLTMEQKPFSVGVRIEHPQALINEAQWGSAAKHPALGAAEYKLAIHLPSGRHVYSFCMCPGGEVVAAASEEGGIVTNGMSNFARDGKNANAAILVNVDPSDFGSDEVLAGVELQRQIEQRAFQVARDSLGAPYQAPAQRLGAFLASESSRDSQRQGGDESAELSATEISLFDKEAKAFCAPTYERGVVEAPLDEVFPAFVTQALREAIPLMGKKIRGFDDPRAILTAPETRSSSPVRICRNEGFQAYFNAETCARNTKGRICGFQDQVHNSVSRTGVFPCGEGPGFAGGIMSAAADGLKVATEVVQEAVRVCEVTRENSCTSEVSCDSTRAQEIAHEMLRNLEDEDSSLFGIAAVVSTLKNGQPAIFPTDTVYGLGVAVEHAKDPRELYRIKQRDDEKPIAWLVGSLEDLDRYGKIVSPKARELAAKYWPGALTLVVEASDVVPQAFRSKEGTIALRMPNSQTALALIAQVGPIATTSANLSGQPTPASYKDVPEEFKGTIVAIDDGKATGDKVAGGEGKTLACSGLDRRDDDTGIQHANNNLASTVVDCTSDAPQILRSGALDISL